MSFSRMFHTSSPIGLRRRPSRIAAFAALTLLALLASCSALERPYPAKQRFGLPVPAITAESGAATAATSRRPGAIRIERVRVAPPFNGTSLVYQLGTNQYEVDYYRDFVADPSVLLTGGTVGALSDAPGFFALVLPPSSVADAQWRLETTVTRMVGDFRDAGRPVARVDVRFMLLHDSGGATTVEGDWAIDGNAPLASDSADDLPAALGKAYGEALSKLVQRVRGG